ncbi:MAG: sigma-70 family RNA polymerase sigma factor [Deltaproteobacteria bacterium]|nr:sigma-70 family RNA polymerase sigma factor [Deltaproteobacteria bacterium]
MTGENRSSRSLGIPPDTSGLLERRLVARAQRGSAEAFEALASTHYRAVYGLALAISAHPAEASDVAQEALLKAFRKIRSYRNEAPFKTWLMQIARNTLVDRARKEAQHGRKLRALGREETVSKRAPSPEDLLAKKELAEGVWAALWQVEAGYREAVLLFDLYGYSYQEVAQICGVPIGTVKSRLWRGRDALRREVVRSGLVSGAGGRPRDGHRGEEASPAKPRPALECLSGGGTKERS